MYLPSELILNPDGSVFHLHLQPEDLADDVILVGDPGRVELVASFFHAIEVRKENREFKTITGYYGSKRITVLSTGIGTDNIDIVVNELDVLANVDLQKREDKAEHKSLRIIRIGTSGSLQANVPVDSYLLSARSIGFDGLLNFYAARNEVCDLAFEKAFVEAVDWPVSWASPYVVSASPKLIEALQFEGVQKGVTISAPGFYGPQGRRLRLPLKEPKLNDKISAFSYEGQQISNYEMESSAIAGLATLLGHEAATICAIIANRSDKSYSKDYKPVVKNLIAQVLNVIST